MPIVCVLITFVIILKTLIIPTMKYNDALALMETGKYSEAITAFKALSGYKDSTNKINECNASILEGKYNEAVALMDEENIVEAYETLISLDGYKDSADKANSIYKKYKVELIKNAKAGDYINFGTYEQDNNRSNGKEDIEWLVLDKKEGKVLVISRCALDCKQYNTRNDNITWETCTLRKWLNSDFASSAFSDDEKEMIATVTVPVDKKLEYNTNSGNETQDKVFLLSITEANKYFSYDNSRECKPTDYTVANGVSKYKNGKCSWWLRSPGVTQSHASIVSVGGVVYGYGNLVSLDSVAVRPALWINLDS